MNNENDLFAPYCELLPDEHRSLPLAAQVTKLRESIPAEIASLEVSEQVAHLQEMLDRFHAHLEQRRAAKMHAEYREHVLAHYKFKHPRLLDLSQWRFVPKFAAALKVSQSGSPAGLLALPGLFRQVHAGVYVADMLEESFCRVLLDEMDHFETWCEENDLATMRPNSMNKYGVILDDFGFAPLIDTLVQEVMQPIATALFPRQGGNLDSHHAFAVDYEIGKDLDLGFHVDDAEVTLNVCLGRQFAGGDLFFGGVRCRHHQQTGLLPGEDYEFAHAVGQALVHLGKHRHLAQPISQGRRTNMIVWCRSAHFRAVNDDEQACPEWCGVHPYLQDAGNPQACGCGADECEGHGAEEDGADAQDEQE